jgi:acetoin utilization protein AcuB
MTPNPITITPDTSFPQALSTMRKNKIRHLPVVENDRLVGIVVESDLLSNQPSPATTLSVYEIYSLLEGLRVRQIMTHPVLTAEVDWPIEEAARVMVENKVSCLPVMKGEKLAGIITETDIFKVLVEVLGGEEGGYRMTLRMPERVGELAALANQLAEIGGNIVAVTSSALLDSGEREVLIKETGANPESLKRMMEGSGLTIKDMRQTTKVQPRLFG